MVFSVADCHAPWLPQSVGAVDSNPAVLCPSTCPFEQLPLPSPHPRHVMPPGIAQNDAAPFDFSNWPSVLSLSLPPRSIAQHPWCGDSVPSSSPRQTARDRVSRLTALYFFAPVGDIPIASRLYPWGSVFPRKSAPRRHTTLACLNPSISWALKPNSASTSSVCSPNSGGRAAILLGVRDSPTGWPTRRM